jgi:hypothetical protein|tara:strand:+ start:66 stop:188 length:123 start_codon:yes stop_codon:yes gene_type:complete
MIDFIIGVVLIVGWNSYLIFKMRRDGKELSKKKETPEVRK